MTGESPIEPSREELVALIQTLSAENAALKARIAELERRLGLNSSNSSKPPSSDGLKKLARVSSLRERSGKTSGAQPGHDGETLRQVAKPDHVIEHHPPVCSGCGEPLTPGGSGEYAARQVFDLPEPRPLAVTEHRAFSCRCEACGATTRAAFPEDVRAPAQYGVKLAAFAVYLLHYQLLPEDRLVELMADLFGVKLAAGTIAAMSRNCAGRLRSFAEALRDLVAKAPVKHMDETGCRIGGKTQWLHVACTTLLTFYRTCAKRGEMLANVVGVVVHDHWKPYYTMQGVSHALCNAHHLRELKALVEIEKEEWARQMQRLLRRACHAARRDGDHERQREHAEEEQRRAARTKTPPNRPQSPLTLPNPQGRRFALPSRPRRPLHQQRGRAGRPNDEGEAENLRRVPDPRWGRRFRHPSLRHINRPKTRLEPHRDLVGQPHRSGRPPPIRIA